MGDPKFTRVFLRRIVELEKTASSVEMELLDRTMARIIANPYLRERFATFYDPLLPTYFVRANPFLIEFTVEEATDAVTFVSLFYRS